MLAGLLWLCCAQAAGPDVMLARVRQHMARVLSSLPNYTCEQTVERSLRLTRERRFRKVDTLRLEVSFVEGRELFAWPGAEKFGEQRLEEMVGAGGAIGTGAFAMHADSLFRTSAPVFTYVGEEVENGRKLVKYNYRVPRNLSRFYIKSGGQEALVGYRGSFRADAETLDVVWLQVEAEEIPAALGVKRSGSAVEYGRQRIGDAEFLLPVSSELVMVDDAGNENTNRTRFGGCRHYAGDSVIRFDEPAAPVAEAVKPGEGAPLPAGLTLELYLDRVLEGAGAAVGDPVSAILARDVKKDGAVLMPKGARFSGRLTRLERREALGIGVYHVIGMLFDKALSGNVRTAFRGHLEDVTFGNQLYYVPFGRAPRTFNIWNSVASQPLAGPTEGEGVFCARGPLRLPARTRMLWETLP